MDMFVKTSKFVGLAIVLMLLVVGCGTREPVVARVGREKITLKEFKDNFIQRYHSEENAKHQSYQDREKVLKEMAVALAKYQEGVALGIDKRPEVSKMLEQTARRKALDLLYEDKVINAVINDVAAKHFYDQSAEEVKARHILLKTPPADSVGADTLRIKARIDSIKNAINKGLSFKTAAKLFSDDVTSAADSGSLDWFQWGRMVDEFQEAAWGAKPGQMVGPVRTSYGYHLIMVEERRPVQGRGSFEDSKQAIKAQLKQVEGEKLMKQAREYVDNLHKINKLEYNDANIEIFRKKLADPNTPKNQDVAPAFTADQKQLVVANYKGGKVTIDSLVLKIGGNAHRVDWKDRQPVLDLIHSIVEPGFLERRASTRRR
jgi:parvulin-like peptidyl-prolyl isomerase